MPTLGTDVFRVSGPAGLLHEEPLAALGVTRAQTLAQKVPKKDRAEFTVSRESLFGPTVLLYRVISEPDGSVSTFVVNKDD